MQLATERRGDALVVRVEEPRIDAAVAIQFKDAMREATRAPGTPVMLDLSRVDFVDSSGLGALVTARKYLSAEQRPLELAGMTPPVAKVLRLTRMDSVFTLHADAPDGEGPARGA